MRILAILTIILAAFLAPLTVYADENEPDSVTVEEAKAYTGLLETGDLLLAIRYDIAYSTGTPDNGANVVFVVWAEDGAIRFATNTPYPYFDSDSDGDSDGYGDGVASIYLSEEQTAAAGLTDGSGSWNVAWGSENISVYVEGNPSSFSDTLPYGAQLLSAGDYTADETTATNQAALGSDVMRWAAELQAVHAVALIEEGQNLLNSSNGSGYFTLAIPGLRQMAPTIFSTRTESPTAPTPVAGQGTFADASEGLLDGSTYYGQGFVTLASDMGLPSGSIEGGLVALLCVALVGFGAKTWGTRGATMMLVFSAVFMLPVMMIGTGWVPWAAGGVAILSLGAAAVIKQSNAFSG